MLEQGEVGETQRVLGAPALHQQVGDEEDCRGQQPPQVDGSQEGHGAVLVGMAGRGTVCRASRRAVRRWATTDWAMSRTQSRSGRRRRWGGPEAGGGAAIAEGCGAAAWA